MMHLPLLANWLRAGLASKRITTPYPREREQLEQVHPHWKTLVSCGGSCEHEPCQCTQLCPTEAIRHTAKGAIEVDQGACVACGRCVHECPNKTFAWTNTVDTAARQRVELVDGTKSREIQKLDKEFEPDWGRLDGKTFEQFRQKFRRSLHVRHIDVGSCNACESEVLALSNPYYNFHRLGIFFTSSPRHADVLLVTGALTYAMQPVLLTTYEAMPRPRIVIAAGVCPIHGGVFHNSEHYVGPLNSVIPVDVYIPGCPPTPYALIRGLLLAVSHREECTDHG